MLFYDWLLVSSLPMGAIIGIFNYRKLPLDIKYLTYFFVVTLILEVAADYQMIVHHKNNLVYYHTMTVCQYTLLTLVLRRNIEVEKTKKMMIVSIYCIFLIELGLIFTLQNLSQSPSLIRLITRILLLYWILCYLQSLLKIEKPAPLLTIPVFWVCIGILIHFISFLQVGLMRYMIETNRQTALFWYHFSIWFDVLFYLICTYSIFLTIYQRPQVR